MLVRGVRVGCGWQCIEAGDHCADDVLVQMTIVLDMAHKSNENGSNVCLPLTKDTAIVDTIVINWPDVVMMTALSVDLAYATKGAVFMTYSQPTGNDDNDMACADRI